MCEVSAKSCEVVRSRTRGSCEVSAKSCEVVAKPMQNAPKLEKQTKACNLSQNIVNSLNIFQNDQKITQNIENRAKTPKKRAEMTKTYKKVSKRIKKLTNVIKQMKAQQINKPQLNKVPYRDP